MDWRSTKGNFWPAEQGGMSIHSIQIQRMKSVRHGLVGLMAALAALILFSDPLMQLLNRWGTQEEYSHGFLIPVVAAWLVWTCRRQVGRNVGRATWTGPTVVLLAMVMHLVGEISATPILSQVSFVVALVGLVLGLGGYPLYRATIIPILFLLFAIPMPYFIDNALSLKLQLVSSQLGAFFIRSSGIPVYLTGNVIDLGYYQLEIVEACSGLRYIYPLLSLSFLAAYFFKAPIWQRLLIFISVVPIAIVMNSVRIGVVGVTVNYWGSQAAHGILHLFEGWFVFLVGAGALAIEIFLLARIFGKSFFEVLSLPKIPPEQHSGLHREDKIGSPAVASLVLLCVGAVAIFHISTRAEIIPDRPRFVSFPEQIAAWQGHAFLLKPEMEQIVRPDDYLLSDYKASDGKVVNLYAAYYASQRKNDKPHSPGECIPANGWDVTSFQRTTYIINGMNWPLNRAVIQKNTLKQLVYYWFNERGRAVANEYLAKWYLHADAAFMNRTDGALIRVVTQIHSGETESEADLRLQAFLRDTMPTLSEYLPPPGAPRVKSVRFGPNNS